MAHGSLGRALIAVLVLAGCSSTEVRWEVSFSDDVDVAVVETLRLRVRRGSCGSGQTVYDRAVRRGEGPPAIGELVPSLYAFEGVAFDRECGTVAEACVSIQLAAGEATTVPLVLSAVPRQLCAEACVEGICPEPLRPSDGGMDVGADVAIDASGDALDAMRDVAPDSVPDIDGAVEEMPAEVSPETLCDGNDQDDDSVVDEGFSIGAACELTRNGCTGVGRLECDPGEPSMVRCGGELGTPEWCDGIDNDCDGDIDEVFAVGEACTIEGGACSEDGLFECASDGTDVECSATLGSGSPEMCNGEDDDCDGRTDEGFEVGESCSLAGCAGVRVCTVAGSAECATTTLPERCDGADNDCDGNIDEDVSGTCPTPGCSTAGTAVCESGELVCMGGGPSEAMACDGMDTDCDGFLDNRSATGDICRDDSPRCQSFREDATGRSYLYCIASSWFDARAQCAEYGYELAAIDGAAENAFITAKVLDISGSPRFWIGASAPGGPETMQWLDGRLCTAGYNNFASGQPNGANTCLRLELVSFGVPGVWADSVCGATMPFLCKH